MSATLLRSNPNDISRPVVHSNTIHSMLAILRAMFHLQIDYADSERIKDSQMVFATVHANKEELNEDLAAAMLKLWRDDGVQECYRRSNEVGTGVSEGK